MKTGGASYTGCTVLDMRSKGKNTGLLWLWTGTFKNSPSDLDEYATVVKDFIQSHTVTHHIQSVSSSNRNHGSNKKFVKWSVNTLTCFSQETLMLTRDASMISGEPSVVWSVKTATEWSPSSAAHKMLRYSKEFRMGQTTNPSCTLSQLLIPHAW